MKRFRTILAAFVLTVIAGTSSMLAQTPDTAPEATGPVKMFGVPVTLPYEEFKAAVEQSPEFQAFKNFVLTNIPDTKLVNIKNGFVANCSKGISFDTENYSTKAYCTIREMLSHKYGKPELQILTTMNNEMYDRRGVAATYIGINSVNTYGLVWTISGGKILLTNLRNDRIYLQYIDDKAIENIYQNVIIGL